ncbi:MAG: 16S rRNA (adenine(1518)-N(6)/adenine(1519)-N(6))-dimethyltransferase RsmA [Desulfovibrionaceae bacterium]
MSTPIMQVSHRAKKSLGQHFLRDPQISERIVRLLQCSADDAIIEIGPGPGALTQILQQQVFTSLLLLEKDTHWAAVRQKFADTRTQAVLMDALTFDWKKLLADRPWKIIGNLPYNVASPLMWDIFSQAAGLRRAVFMVQKEVGQRLAAPPDSAHYGGLSVWVQSFVVPHWAFVVGPNAFSPPPKVDSAVVSFTPLAPEKWPADSEKLAWLIKICFQNRRKQLGSIFRQNGILHLMEKLEALGINPQRRPETLSPKDFQQILVKA